MNRLRRAAIALGAFFAATLSVTTALADPPSPSAAPTLQVGVPYTGSLSDTGTGIYGWMRLPALHRRDAVQLAVSNDNAYWIGFCLVPPVDDFGADRAIQGCRQWSGGTDPGRKNRVRLTYGGATGQAYLVVRSGCCPGGGTYTVTLEAVAAWVGVGWAQRRSVSRRLELTAFARYGDNAPVTNGTKITLSWKPAGARRTAWKKLAVAATANGQAVLRGTLPARTRGRRVDLSACAASGSCAHLFGVVVR